MRESCCYRAKRIRINVFTLTFPVLVALLELGLWNIFSKTIDFRDYPKYNALHALLLNSSNNIRETRLKILM
jgi:hypothetical protein